MLPAPCRSQQSAATETLRAYLQGLSDAGWRGDSWLARFGYTASAALRYTVMTVAEMRGDARDEGRYAAIEQRRGRPIEQVMEQHAVLIHFLPRRRLFSRPDARGSNAGRLRELRPRAERASPRVRFSACASARHGEAHGRGGQSQHRGSRAAARVGPAADMRFVAMGTLQRQPRSEETCRSLAREMNDDAVPPCTP
jgi:hypothetical protein